MRVSPPRMPLNRCSRALLLAAAVLPQPVRQRHRPRLLRRAVPAAAAAVIARAGRAAGRGGVWRAAVGRAMAAERELRVPAKHAQCAAAVAVSAAANAGASGHTHAELAIAGAAADVRERHAWAMRVRQRVRLRLLRRARVVARMA